MSHVSVAYSCPCHMSSGLTPKIDRATWAFIKFDMRHVIGLKFVKNVTLSKITDKDMRHCHFLKSTCNIGDLHQWPQFKKRLVMSHLTIIFTPKALCHMSNLRKGHVALSILGIRRAVSTPVMLYIITIKVWFTSIGAITSFSVNLKYNALSLYYIRN